MFPPPDRVRNTADFAANTFATIHPVQHRFNPTMRFADRAAQFRLIQIGSEYVR